MTNHPDDSVLSRTNIEHVIRDIAQLSGPEESANNVAERVLEATCTKSRFVPTPGGRSRVHMFIALVSSTLALSAVVLLAPDFFTGSVAFGQVQQRLKSTQSLQYVEYRTEAAARRELAEAEQLIEMMPRQVDAMKENGDMAEAEQLQEFIVRLKSFIQELEKKIDNGEPVVRRRVWIQGRYLHRAEESVMGSRMVSISNAQTGESVTLDPDRKRCTLLKTQTVLNMKSGEKTVTPLGPNPAQNFYAAMTKIPPGEVTAIGEKQLSGRQAIGFRQTEDGDDSVIRRTYWIDKQTKLPVQIRAEVEVDGVVVSGAIVRDMVFNKKIDPQMFSTTPPEGYSIREGGIMGLDSDTPAH